MDQEKFDAYRTDRYEDQISWYEKRSAQNKKNYTSLQWGVIVLSSCLPVLITVAPKLLTIPMSIVLAIGTAALKTFKFQENWLSYRTIAESLKKEPFYMDAGLHGYGSASDKKQLFVERVEALISQENTVWVTTQKQKGDKPKKGSG